MCTVHSWLHGQLGRGEDLCRALHALSSRSSLLFGLAAFEEPGVRPPAGCTTTVDRHDSGEKEVGLRNAHENPDPVAHGKASNARPLPHVGDVLSLAPYACSDMSLGPGSNVTIRIQLMILPWVEDAFRSIRTIRSIAS